MDCLCAGSRAGESERGQPFKSGFSDLYNLGHLGTLALFVFNVRSFGVGGPPLSSVSKKRRCPMWSLKPSLPCRRSGF